MKAAQATFLVGLFLLEHVAASIGDDIRKLRDNYHWPSGTEAIGGPPSSSQVCAVSKAAYDYANFIQPHLAPNRNLFDALELHTVCGFHEPEPLPPSIPTFPIPSQSETVYYVDGNDGNDSGPGTVSKPLRTVAMAIEKATVSKDSTVVLRKGVHWLTETVQLNFEQSGLTIMNYPGEEAWVSGGELIKPKWEHVTSSLSGFKFKEGLNVWATQLDMDSVQGLNKLDLTDPVHAKMVRARFPNKNVDAGTQEKALLDSKGVVWEKPKGWGKPGFNVSRSVFLPTPFLNQSAGEGYHFTYGVGGWSCDRYTPAGGFWCSNQSNGGGSGWELMVPGAPLFPVGLTVEAGQWGGGFSSEMPPEPSTWLNKSTAVVETWTNGWSTTFWEVTDILTEGTNSTFVFGGSGGQQSGRGFHIDPPATPPPELPISTEGGWKVENAIELLDIEEEFFFDEHTQTLYLVHNSTGAPEADGWVVPRLKTLLNITGTAVQPTHNVTILGVGFRDSVYTYLDEWGIPSGGDWALHRGGAVFIEGVENVVINQSSFTLLDGNAVFLSGYTRNVAVDNSSFAYIGDNAMAAWGYTRDLKSTGFDLPAGVGIDGTDGNQPRFSKITNNVVREIGMNERQSSAWSEAKACQSHVSHNLFYNMPRAAININDGFGGATLIENNMMANTCRESGDHGPFNSWDRQPFQTDVATGAPSLVPAYNEIRQNFFISNYGAGFGVDNDDTSSYYKIHDNFFYLGGGVKCDYDGHEKRFYNNVMLGTTAGCWHTCSYKKGYPDYCYNNTLVQAAPVQGRPQSPFAIIWFCDAKNVSHILPDYSNEVQMGDYIHSNRIFNDQAEATVTCGYSGPPNETTVPLSAFTSVGLMKNSVVGTTPSDEAVLGWAKQLLGMN